MASNERGARPFLRPGGPGTRFAEAEHAADALGTLRRLFGYFSGEKPAVAGIFITVAMATLLGVLAPLLQSLDQFLWRLCPIGLCGGDDVADPLSVHSG